MNYLWNQSVKIMGASLLVWQSVAFAADIPTVVEQDAQDTQINCVDNNAADCINTRCPNSPDLDCNDKCRADAVNHCKDIRE